MYSCLASRNTGTSVGQGRGRKIVESNGNLWKTKKSLPIIRPVTRRAQGSESPLKEFLPLPGKLCWTYCSCWDPLSEFFASAGVPVWLGPANYACYSSTIMLSSKIIKQTIDNLCQFDLDKS